MAESLFAAEGAPSDHVTTLVNIQEDASLEFVIPAHETFSVDGTADNQETFTLSHDAIAEISIETTPTDADDQVAEMALGTSAAQTSRLTLGRGRIVFPDGVDHGPATSDGFR